jgi:predicted N-acetyltransferase YhbS
LRTETDLTIRPLRADEVPEADRIWRLAFGTFLGLPDPLSFRGDVSPVRTRYLADPSASFAAELDGELVGSNFAINWNSVGFFGPLSVRPDLWDRGIARRLMEAVIDAFDGWGTRHVGLFTFGHSPKHLALYQKFGFWPRFVTLIMSKPVAHSDPGTEWTTYSALSDALQQTALEACGELAGSWYEDLDLSLEIRATAQNGFGDTLLMTEGDRLAGFAVCHCGPDTEAGSGNCYIKFGAVRPGLDAEASFVRLFESCEAMAAARGLTRLAAGVNTARREAYRLMLARGFRGDVQGLAMDCPDEPAYNRPGVYIIDDWR